MKTVQVRRLGERSEKTDKPAAQGVQGWTAVIVLISLLISVGTAISSPVMANHDQVRDIQIQRAHDKEVQDLRLQLMEQRLGALEKASTGMQQDIRTILDKIGPMSESVTRMWRWIDAGNNAPPGKH